MQIRARVQAKIFQCCDDEERKMYARLGRDIKISLENYIKYKQILGADNFYLSMSGV